jgi:hypothetical protein
MLAGIADAQRLSPARFDDHVVAERRAATPNFQLAHQE